MYRVITMLTALGCEPLEKLGCELLDSDLALKGYVSEIELVNVSMTFIYFLIFSPLNIYGIISALSLNLHFFICRVGITIPSQRILMKTN